jgi:hypothetical protein
MILADTSVWVEFFRVREPVFSLLQELVETRQVSAPECVFGELLQGVRDGEEAKLIREYWAHLPKFDETGIWIEAGTLSSERKLFYSGIGLIDAALMVFSQRNHTKIWTLDKKLQKAIDPEELFAP